MDTVVPVPERLYAPSPERSALYGTALPGSSSEGRRSTPSAPLGAPVEAGPARPGRLRLPAAIGTARPAVAGSPGRAGGGRGRSRQPPRGWGARAPPPWGARPPGRAG